MIHRGRCHCGQVAFEVEGELTAVVSCNCSICSRKGALLWAVSRDRLRLLTPEDRLAEYMFDRRTIRHRFCRTCGVHPFAESATGDEPTVYVNVWCLDGFDPAAVTIVDFDGRSV